MPDAEARFNEFDSGWRGFLQKVELAKNYNGLTRLESPFLPRDPIAEAILPTLLYVQLASLIDDGLEAFQETRKGTRSDKKRSLSDRIELLRNDLSDPDALHAIRQARNPLTHDPHEFVSWQDLDNAIASVHEEFRGLVLVHDRPEYRFFSERSEAKASDDPRIAVQFEYQFGLKLNGKVVLRLSWTHRVPFASAS